MNSYAAVATASGKDFPECADGGMFRSVSGSSANGFFTASRSAARMTSSEPPRQRLTRPRQLASDQASR